MQIRIKNNYVFVQDIIYYLPLNYTRSFTYLKIGPYLHLEDNHPIVYKQLLDLSQRTDKIYYRQMYSQD